MTIDLICAAIERAMEEALSCTCKFKAPGYNLNKGPHFTDCPTRWREDAVEALSRHVLPVVEERERRLVDELDEVRQLVSKMLDILEEYGFQLEDFVEHDEEPSE